MMPHCQDQPHSGANHSWIQITSGRCPVECQWVVARLVTEITRYCTKKGVRVTAIDSVQGDSDGTLKSALLGLSGSMHEACLVRYNGTVLWRGQSPYRRNHKRKNWYVGVETLHHYEESESGSALIDSQITIEAMRSRGPGGQHVNRRETAVRITHVPTGISVVGREERSQEMNKKLAIARLSKLLREQAQQSKRGFEQERWKQHDRLERGNPVLVFKGKNFEEVKQ